MTATGAAILVLNAGSSSLKYKLYAGSGLCELARGRVERIGAQAHLEHHTGSRHVALDETLASHSAAVARVFELLSTTGDPPPLADGGALVAIGHRVVHGGASLCDPVIVDDAVRRAIALAGEFAPSHARGNLAGIDAARQAFPEVPQVAVFDTTFFRSLPAAAYRYAVPEAWYRDHGVRRFGFHGLSHRWLTRRAAELLGKQAPDLVTLHLGNGASVAAIRAGVAIDTSMGLTPLEGLVMGTRCGDLDPSVVLHLLRRGLDAEQIASALEHDSGLLGLSCIAADLRDVERAARQGDARAELALAAFARGARKYLGAFLIELGACDALVFSGGIGERSAAMRARILAGLAPFGIEVDPAQNAADAEVERLIHAPSSRIAIAVIPTDEERLIVEDVRDCLAAAGR